MNTQRIILTEGGKGGGGKTTFAASLIDFLRSNNIPLTLLDCDIENEKSGSLSHLFKGTPKLDITTPRGLDQFVDLAFNEEASTVVADLGAGSGQWTFNWFDAMYEPAAEAGCRFLCIGVVTAESATVDTALHWAETLRDRVDYLIVCNQRNGRDFSDLSTTRFKKFLDATHAPIINMEARVESIQQDLDRAGLSLAAYLDAAAESLPPSLKQWSTRIRIRGYLNRINKQLESIIDTLR